VEISEKDCIIDILNMSYSAQCGHIPSALSMVTYLLNIFDENKICPKRFHFIFGKPFGSQAYYSIFSRLGWIESDISKFGSTNDNEWRYIIQANNPVVTYIDESMGNCLAVANGYAMAKKDTYINISDAAFQEGSIWEAIQFAGAHKLEKIFMTVDYNGIQALGKTKDINDLGRLELKLKSFGWNVYICDGHNNKQIKKTIRKAFARYNKGNNGPIAILFKTQKGHGVKFMEDNTLWHYKTLSKEDLIKAIEEINV